MYKSIAVNKRNTILIMIAFAGVISRFINNHPTLQMLALAFLIVIGVMLIAEGFHQEISKSYIYTAIAFSLVVELLNMRLRKSTDPVKLNTRAGDEDLREDLPSVDNVSSRDKK